MKPTKKVVAKEVREHPTLVKKYGRHIAYQIASDHMKKRKK